MADHVFCLQKVTTAKGPCECDKPSSDNRTHSHFLWNLQFHQILVIFNQINSVHPVITHSILTHFNIVLPQLTTSTPTCSGFLICVYFLIIPMLQRVPFISGSLVYSLRFHVVGITSCLILKLLTILCIVKTHQLPYRHTLCYNVLRLNAQNLTN